MLTTRHYLIQLAANAIQNNQLEAAEVIISSLPEAAPVGPFRVIAQNFNHGDKIATIKAIRNVSGLGLKEAKEMSEQLPATVATFSTQEKATDALKMLLDHGCTAVIG